MSIQAEVQHILVIFSILVVVEKCQLTPPDITRNFSLESSVLLLHHSTPASHMHLHHYIGE